MYRDSFVFFSSWIKGIQNFSERKKMEIIYALVNYCIYGIEPTSEKPHVQLAFNFAKPSIDKNIKRYLAKVERQRKDDTQDEHNVNTMSTQCKHDENIVLGVDDNDDVNVNDDDNSSDTKVSSHVIDGSVKPRKRFTPPTEAQVQEYCIKMGYDVDAEAFVAFYESKGWKVGNQPMKSWKAATVTWMKKNKAEGAGKVDRLEERKRTLVQDDSRIGKLNTWMLKYAPYIVGHFDTLLTEEQYTRLVESYGRTNVSNTITNLENRHDMCDKYSNLYTTLVNWLNSDGKQ